MRSDGAVKPHHIFYVSTAGCSRSEDANVHSSNASKRAEEKRCPCQLFLPLEIIVVAAAVSTTAACAAAFVIIDAAANTAADDEQEAIDALRTHTSSTEWTQKTANKCGCHLREDITNDARNSKELVRANNLRSVVNKINENTSHHLKALKGNFDSNDFTDTNRMVSNNAKTNDVIGENNILRQSKEALGIGTDVNIMAVTNKYYNRKISGDIFGALLSLPLFTIYWISLCGFAASLSNILSAAAVMLRALGPPVMGGSGGGGRNGHNTKPFVRPRPTITVSCLMFGVLLLFGLPTVHSDDGDNFFLVNSFSMGPETTTPEFDYASRGQKKFGDKCESTLECGFPGSICDAKLKSCQCTQDLPVTNHIDKCGKEAAVNESCFFNEQCEVKHYQTECRDGRCACRYEMTPFWAKDGTVECKGRQDKRGPETYIDPAMIGVLVGMALMFVIICVVLRLFSQARWRENRTIFNTPNPRLMNVSLLRDGKLLHGQERRGSRMSMRAPSRQPSMASLRPHSPNPSLGKTGRMPRSKSNTRSSDSRVSDASNCSRLLEHASTHAPHTPSTHIAHLQTSPQARPLQSAATRDTANAINTYVPSNPDIDVERAMRLATPPAVVIKTNKL